MMYFYPSFLVDSLMRGFKRFCMRVSLLFFLVLMLCPAVKAQQQLAFRNYTMDEGLPSNFINDIFQDSKGLIWLATDQGIGCFDGLQIKQYTTDHGLSANLIYGIAEDSEGAIWAASYKGAAKLQDGYFVQTIADKDLGVVTGIIADTLGNCYIGGTSTTGDAYFAIKSSDGNWVKKNTDMRPNTHRIACFSDGRVLGAMDQGLCWLLSNNGAFEEKPITYATATKALLETERWQKAFAEVYKFKACIFPLANREAYLCVGSQNLIRFKLDEQDSLHVIDTWKLPLNLYYDLLPYKNGILMAADNGLHYYDCNTRQIQLLSWINRQHFESLMMGKDSMLWIGSYGTGLFKSIGHRIQSLALPSDKIGRMLNNSAGKVWVGANDGVYLLEKDGRILGKNTSVTNVTCLAFDPDSTLLIGNYRHLFKYSTEELLYGENPQLLGTVNSGASGITYSENKTGWIGTYGIGMHRLGQMPDITYVFNKVNLTSGRGGFMTENVWNSSLGIWGSTNSEGVFLLKEQEDIQLGKKEGLPSNNVHTVFEDDKHRVWIGTDHGFALYDSSRILREYQATDGLVGTKVLLFFQDRDNRFWVLTDEALHWLEGDKLRALHDIPIKFTTREKVSKALFDNHTQFLWLSTGKEAYRIDLNDYQPYTGVPPVYLAFLMADGKLVPSNSLLPATTVEVCISYQLPDFKEERANRIRYKLEGYQEEWKEVLASESKKLCFNGLMAGNYKLLVKPVSPTGMDGEVHKLASWEIRPFWWQTWKLRLLALVASIILVAGIVWKLSQLRYQKKLRAIELEHRLQVERSRISRELHDNVGAHLSNIILSIDRASMSKKPTESQSLKSIGTTARNAMASLREAIWLLHKSSVTAESLFDRLKVHTQGLLQPENGYTFEENISSPMILSPSVGLHVFRIIQEALNNSLKHSQCTCICLSVVTENGLLIWKVADNGKGFPKESACPPAGYGLDNMKYRAAEIHGTIEWQENKEGGITVKLSIPTTESV